MNYALWVEGGWGQGKAALILMGTSQFTILNVHHLINFVYTHSKLNGLNNEF